MPSKEKSDKGNKRAKKYKEKLVVKGSFMDVINASVKHADDNSAPKQKTSKDSQ